MVRVEDMGFAGDGLAVQVNSATSWSLHMRVSRENSGGLPSIIWL